jgi:hypothetical protein
MIRNVVHSSATNEQVRKILADLPNFVRTGPHARAILTRVGMTVLGRIKRAFIVKARGGTDEAGERWKPLSPKTIAYSKTRKRGRGGRTKAERNRPDRPSQALNTRQQARWWELYRQGLAMFKGDKGTAARRAWGILKREGAVTLLMKYGGRQVDILRDTGLLLNSLSPGATVPEQIFRTGNGEVEIGTNRKWAGCHHRGVPGRIPQRRLWPAPKNWPANWWKDITEQIVQGVVDATSDLLRGGP